MTVQVYWSNERNELDEVDELIEVDELDEIENTWTVPEWSTSFSKREVLHLQNVKYCSHSPEWSSSMM